MEMNNYLKLFCFLFVVGYCTCDSVTQCNSQSTNSSQYFGTKTPYRVLENTNRSPYSVPYGCRPLQLWMLIRHGTRYPSSSVIFSMRERLPLLRDSALERHAQGLGSLCEDELALLRGWSPQVEVSEEKCLAHEGEDEMADLAERMMDRLPGLLQDDYSNHTYKFRYTATQRTRKSARYFVDGLFGRWKSRHVWYPDALPRDPVLRFYKLCSKWQQEVDDNPETALRERRAFEDTEHFTKARQSVAAALGLDDIATDDVNLMYTTCAFESAWDKRKASPWCAVFDTQAMEVLEYAEDLEYYWNDGYGYQVNYEQACPPVHHMLKSFQQAAEKGLPKAVFHFTHSGALLKVLAYLGLYQDQEPLLHSNFEEHRESRQWRVGRIDSFAANIGAVLYRCLSDAEPRVMLLHQERPVSLAGCESLCPLSVWMQRHPSCLFHAVCENNARLET